MKSCVTKDTGRGKFRAGIVRLLLSKATQREQVTFSPKTLDTETSMRLMLFHEASPVKLTVTHGEVD